MTTEYLINALDKIGARFVCKAYKYAYHGAGKPKGFPESFWEKIKIWENFSEKSEDNIEIKSDYDLDAEAATKRIEDAKKGNKKKYLDDAMKLAKKYNEKSNDAKSDTVSLNEKLKSVATNSDLKYNEEKKKLAEKYKSQNFNASYKNGDNTMEISQKDLKKIMKAMNTINKHFAEEVEDDLAEENAENSEEEMTTIELPSEIAEAVKMALESGDSDDESEEDEDVDEEEVEDEESDEDDESEEDEESEDDESEEEMATIELPVEIAEAVKEAFESCENCEEDEDDESEDDYEEESEEDEEVEENFSRKSRHFANNMGYCEGCNEKVKVVKGKCVHCGEYVSADNMSFSMKSFYRFAETVTDTIEHLNKKVNKLATEIQDAANEKTIQFSKKDFYRFAETVTETIENIAEKVEQLESNVEKKEITKDISNLTDSFNDADDFLTSSDEKEVKDEVIVDNMDNEDAPIYAGTENVDSVDMPVDEQFSKRYNNIKNFLTL